MEVGNRVLDNAVWHAAIGPRRPFAKVLPAAACFDPEVSPFAAVPDEPGPDAWADLANLVGSGGTAVLFRRSIDVPSPWTVASVLEGVQMTAEHAPVDDTRGDEVALGPADAEEVLALIAETQPGPFRARTLELGGYLGVRIDGRLVAMGGERLRCDGFTEISAVCTAPDYRGRGLGGRLVRALVRDIRARGEEAFLHAAATNTNAIRLYQALGFTARCQIDVTLARAPS